MTTAVTGPERLMNDIREHYKNNPHLKPVREIWVSPTCCCAVACAYLKSIESSNKLFHHADAMSHASRNYGIPSQWVYGFIDGWNKRDDFKEGYERQDNKTGLDGYLAGEKFATEFFN